MKCVRMFPPCAAEETLEILLREFRTSLEHYRLSGDQRHLEAVGTFPQEMDRWMTEMERWSFSPREHELSARVRQGWESLRGEMERITSKPTSLTPENYDTLQRVITHEILEPTHEFLDLNEIEVDHSVTANQAAADRLVFGLLLLGICGAGAGLAAGFWLAWRIIERLERSERAALRAEQLAALGHLAAGMAHELHNPLTSIKMLIQGALTENEARSLEERGAFHGPVLAGRDLDVVDEELTRLEGLVKSFLDFARPPAPERRNVDVSSLVEQTLELIADRASAAGVTVTFHPPRDLVRIALDPGQFRQVVLNLVINALDAVKMGGRIEVCLGQDNEGRLTLRVVDNGCGLPPELGSQIFDPFITSKETGLGLGLSICKRIAEAHGGAIGCKNRPEGGAEFFVRFPASGAKGARRGGFRSRNENEETMPKLLVVDDEPNVLYSIEKTFRSDTLEVIGAQTGREAIELAGRLRPDVAILDVRLSDMSGLEVFDRIRLIDPRLPVIIVTAYGATETAIEAMKRGAYEYLLKPIDVTHLRELVQRALELSRLRHVPTIFNEEEIGGDAERIVGRSPAMQELYKTIGRVAASEVTVLITGESGTGKELVARALWQHSRRADKTFLAINCAALPETLLESELFGHEKGAFTSAERRRIGRFEQAQGGTLFLDEVSDMSIGTQAKLLRVIQEQCFERVGGEETIRTDVRLLAATNKDLEKEVSARRFRNDLFFRLNVFSIHLPPLRERRDDIPLLTDHFVRLLDRTLGRGVHGISPEVRECLAEYSWPGNVRQLQSALKYALIRTSGDVLTLDCLPENLRQPGSVPQGSKGLGRLPDLAERTSALLHAGESDIYRQLCLEMDRSVLDVVLRHVKGNQVQASELLGISRTTLRAKMRALGMTSDAILNTGLGSADSS